MFFICGQCAYIQYPIRGSFRPDRELHKMQENLLERRDCWSLSRDVAAPNPPSSSSMSQDRQPSASGIMSLKRNWDNEPSPLPSTSSTPPASFNKGARRPPQTDAEKAASKLRRMQMLESAVSASVVTPAKRSSDASDPDPRALKRVASSSENASSSTGFVSTQEASDKKPATVSISAKIVLSSEQQEILKLVVNGKNIFFTGSAGSYRSTLLVFLQ